MKYDKFIHSVLVVTGSILLCLAWFSDNAKAQAEGAPLQPGDMIRVTLSREVDDSGDYPVDETGQVGLPIIGMVDVTNTPATQLKRELITRYEEQLRNQTIQVVFLRRVRVLGEVKQPGLYHVDPTMTLADAVVLAGGPTANGKLEEVRIVRAGEKIEANINDAAFQRVESGDHIVIPEKSWASRNSRVLIGGSITAAAIILRTVVN